MVVHLFVAWRCQLALSHQNTCARKHTQTTWVVVNEQPAIDPGALIRSSDLLGSRWVAERRVLPQKTRNASLLVHPITPKVQ